MGGTRGSMGMEVSTENVVSIAGLAYQCVYQAVEIAHEKGNEGIMPIVALHLEQLREGMGDGYYGCPEFQGFLKDVSELDPEDLVAEVDRTFRGEPDTILNKHGI